MCRLAHLCTLWLTIRPVRAKNRTQRRRLEVRDRILAAAEELFDQDGVDATKVESICDRADVALRTFFNHFPSKRDLVHQLAVQATLELAAQIGAAHQEGSTTRERLELFFERSAESAREAGPMHRELLGHLVAVHIPGDVRHARDAMLDLLRAGVGAGDVVIRSYPVETLADTILGTFYRLIIDWANQEGYPIEEHLAHAARFLCDAIAPVPRESPG